MQPFKDKLHLTHFLLFAILVCLGFLIGRITLAPPLSDHGPHSGSKKDDFASREQNDPQWNFISPLLDCLDSNSISNQQVNGIKSSVHDYIDNNSKNGVTEVSMYFRDLNLGPWFEINSGENFFPASLLKVPLMMSVLKQAMDDPTFMSRTVVYSGGSRNNEFFRAPQELHDGTTYTMEDVLNSMIKYSDNNASHVLSLAVDEKKLLDSYTFLGIPSPSQNDYQITVRTYASFFRILYNSTFLDRPFSENALKLLSQTTFNNGIVAGVPPSVVVAHKFGERQLESGKKQLHDCGIVYAPGRPYLLCVMTRGTDFTRLDDVIAGISKIVYDKAMNK